MLQVHQFGQRRRDDVAGDLVGVNQRGVITQQLDQLRSGRGLAATYPTGEPNFQHGSNPSKAQPPVYEAADRNKRSGSEESSEPLR